MNESLDSQVSRLASFIMSEIPGEPSQDQGAIDTAIRLLSRHAEVRKVHEIQGQPGNWDYSEYMQGMYNGLELALALLEGREPDYRQSPEQWLADQPRTKAPVPIG